MKDFVAVGFMTARVHRQRPDVTKASGLALPLLSDCPSSSDNPTEVAAQASCT